jgi:halogenation protein CepH
LTRRRDLSYDVIVVGGGPGGSTTATMLARQGARVLLLERERFPRDHVGESLLPASVPVLEELGVLPAVQQAGFLPKWGATMVWGKDRTPWSWYFKETNQQYPHSYQVWRPQFDLILLDNSRAAGVEVRERHRVLEVLFDHGRATGVRYQAEMGPAGPSRPASSSTPAAKAGFWLTN